MRALSGCSLTHPCEAGRPRFFTSVVPWLVGLATVLIAVHPALSKWVTTHREPGEHTLWPWTGAVGTYGGYFGAAQGVMLMAVLGLAYDVDPQRSNAAKNILAASANVTAAVVFALSGAVVRNQSNDAYNDFGLYQVGVSIGLGF